jgi:hypothetical protein
MFGITPCPVTLFSFGVLFPVETFFFYHGPLPLFQVCII